MRCRYRTERRILDVISGKVVNAADLGGDAAPAAWTQPDPPERAMGRRWLAVAAAALVTGAYAAQPVVRAAEPSPAPIAGIAPSYGPKTVSAVPNAAAIARRIWLPGLDAGYDPQGLAVGRTVGRFALFGPDANAARKIYDPLAVSKNAICHGGTEGSNWISRSNRT